LIAWDIVLTKKSKDWDLIVPLCVQNVLRCLFCLGLLGRYGAESIEAIEDEDIDMSHLLELYKYFLGLEDFDIKARALQVPIFYTF
jgi:hypothetical protein